MLKQSIAILCFLLSPLTVIANPTATPANSADNSVIVAQIIKVFSGNIALVLTEHGKMYVRLAGIDTPDLRQPFGEDAKKTFSDLVLDKTVIMRLTGLDPCGRSVVLMWPEDQQGLDISSQMILNGAAWVYRQYANNKYLLSLEEKARETKSGLWSLKADDQVPPWEWRKRARFRGITPSDACPQETTQNHYSQEW
ncbi:MAG: thermonuclease family protein [Legionellales bacterium]|nr:thermonuclease family protein [Legionellales bacterium]